MILRRKAFTLIELLVVISIISALIAITLPCMSKVRKLGQSAACKSNLHSIGLAMKMYLDDSRYIMPLATRMPSLGLDDKPGIVFFLSPYLRGEEKVFRCPGDNVKKYFESEGTSYEYNSTLGGKNVDRSFLATKFKEKDYNIHVIYDYEAYHDHSNFLYADGHVSNYERQ